MLRAVISKLHMNLHNHIVCLYQFLYFLHQYILNHGSLVIFSVAIFFNSRWRPDTMSIVIGTKFRMKLYITKYICANFLAFVINIF